MNNKTLAELQIALQDFLLDKQTDADELTLETPAFSRQERLSIYHQAYRLRLTDALSNDYPALKFYLGDANFTELASQFIETYPSHNPSLRWLGEKLPNFLRAHDDWQQKVQLVELAEFEWTQITAFDAADKAVVSLEDIQALPPESWMTMQMQFHPSLQLLHLYTNAAELWKSLVKNEIAIEPKITLEPRTWLVWRENLQVVYRPLEKPEVWALNAFLTSQTFADVCGGLCEWFDEEKVPMQAAQYLQQWVRSGLVIKIN